jgi:hypothetical protein
MTIYKTSNTRAANEQFCKSWGEVHNSTFVLLFSCSAKFNFSASISQPSQSCQPLVAILTEHPAKHNSLKWTEKNL